MTTTLRQNQKLEYLKDKNVAQLRYLFYKIWKDGGDLAPSFQNPG